MDWDDPITLWLKNTAKGDQRAIEGIWAAYFDQLVRFAKTRLPPHWRRVVDEEDIAISAMESFILRLQRPDCPWQLNNRHDLWRILLAIVVRKTVKQNQKQLAQKRGQGTVVGESGIVIGEVKYPTGIDQILGKEPSPELALQLVEEFDARLASLRDDTLRSVAIAKMQGQTNREIAESTGISLRSVERKLELIRDKWKATAED